MRPRISATVTATTSTSTLSLHDALPISWCVSSLLSGWIVSCPLLEVGGRSGRRRKAQVATGDHGLAAAVLRQQLGLRSEEHTSELQSHVNLVCRLLLEKKKQRRRVLRGR